MRYGNIIFDMYGTLVDIETDESDPRFWEELAEFFSWQGADLPPYGFRKLYDREVMRQMSLVRREHPERLYADIDLLRVFEALYRDGGVSSDRNLLLQTADFFRSRSTLRIGLFDGALDLIDELTDEGCRLFLMTNGQSSFALPELRRLGIDDCFEKIYISSDHLMAKPEREFYDLVLKENGLDREDTVFIGDDIDTDIIGAGGDSIYIHRGGDLTGVKIPAKLVVKNGDLDEAASFLLK